MSDATAPAAPFVPPPDLRSQGPRMDHAVHPAGVITFLLILVAGLGYAVVSLVTDMNAVGESPLAIGAFALLGLALLIALGFEFVNGFHDTANAVATVIYTHRCRPSSRWSGPAPSTSSA